MMTDTHWQKFCEVMGVSEGLDPELASSRQRKAQRKRVEALVSDAVRAQPYDAIAGKLQSINFGYTEVRPSATVLDDLQAQQPGKLVSVSSQDQLFTVPNLPIVSAAVRKDLNGSPPELGEHTMEVLQSIGYSTEECQRLIAQGSVAVSASS
jgi:crotonobetainyl-CoA:carnitine CoA-transferase CaiB-like acyl-CoA transferase